MKYSCHINGKLNRCVWTLKTFAVTHSYVYLGEKPTKSKTGCQCMYMHDASSLVVSL